jgi:hypothetical protein
MQFPHILLVAALAGPVAAPAMAGAQTLDIAVTNTGSETLVCRAAIAHWFSADLGEAAPGATLAFAFGVDVATGGVFQLNDRGDHMAVQRIWCGRKGADWPSRAEIPMDRRAGKVPAPIALNCAADPGGTTACAAP